MLPRSPEGPAITVSSQQICHDNSTGRGSVESFIRPPSAISRLSMMSIQASEGARLGLDVILPNTAHLTITEKVHSMTRNVPWWLRLGGGGWKTSTLGWKLWAVFYALGVWAMNLFTLIYVLMTPSPSIFAVFVVITDNPPQTLGVATVLVMLMSAGVHLATHIWVSFSDWRAPLLYRAQLDFALLDLAHQEEVKLFHGRPNEINMLAGGFIAVSTVLLIVGNLINPGTWPVWTNLFVWGIFGALFVWFPFAVPFGMLIVESRTHSLRNRALVAVLEKLTVTTRSEVSDNGHEEPAALPLMQQLLPDQQPLDGEIRDFATEEIVRKVTSVYWAIVEEMNAVSDRFSFMVPLQLLTLGASLLINILQMYISAQGRQGDATSSQSFEVLSAVVTLLMLVQTLVPLLEVASCNANGRRLQLSLARIPEFMPLVNQSVWWPPVIRVGGIAVSYRLILSVVPVIMFYFYNLVSASRDW